MTREEADRACKELAASSPDRETHTFLARQDESGEWSVVKINVPPAGKALGTATEAKPRPEQPGDPREGKPNPNWGF
ncbi:MAG: hypothetical protein H0V25_08250 [Solirubrobacterales bacterium]|nr:hypothetical protein [Solirubrobacterales bacterium]